MKKYSDEERAEILKEVESVGNVHSVCRQGGISHTTAHNRLKKESLREGRDCPAENRRFISIHHALLPCEIFSRSPKPIGRSIKGFYNRY